MLLSRILHAHMEYLPCEAGRSDYGLPGDRPPAVHTQHVSCIFSPVSPSLIIFFPGVAAVSVKPKYFLATERAPGDTVNKLMSFLPKRLASSLLLRGKMPGSDSSF